MKVRFLGFGFCPGKILSRSEFMKHLVKCSEGDFDLRGKKRMFFCSESEHEEYFTGVFITIKDQKTLPKLKDNKKIVIDETKKGESLMEFNYFVIHKKTYRGMYQHYHQSCSLNQFGIFLKDRYDTEIAERIKGEFKQEKDKSNQREFIDKRKHEYSDFLLSVAVRKEKLESLACDLARISSFDFDVHTIEANEQVFTPAPEYAKKVHKHVVYQKEIGVKVLVNSIKDFINKQGIPTGRIRGYDPDGIERIFEISENPDCFGEYDFDTVARNIKDSDYDNLKDNWIINELIKKADENLFNMEAK